MRERPNRTVSKTVVSTGTVGSNPTPSAPPAKTRTTPGATASAGPRVQPAGAKTAGRGEDGGPSPQGAGQALKTTVADPDRRDEPLAKVTVPFRRYVVPARRVAPLIVE
jgi:hypothetical protein